MANGFALNSSSGAGVTGPAEQSLASSPRERTLVRGPFRLWIDGVGGFFVHTADNLAIGGPAEGGDGAELALLAPLSRRHATLTRHDSGYVLAAHAPSWVAGRPVYDLIDLADGDELRLAENVRLGFRLPSPASGTARIEFRSDHRPQQRVEAVIWMHDTCLLGPGAEQPVRCPAWTESVLLFRESGHLLCRSRGELFIDGIRISGPAAVPNGAVVSGPELCFRVEAAGQHGGPA